MAHGGHTVVATDGGANAGCSSWAVSVPGFGERAGLVQLEDVSAFAAELTALWYMATALQRAGTQCLLRPGCRRRVTVIVDCLSASRMIVQEHPPRQHFKLVAEIRAALTTCRKWADLSVAWVPSHDKCKAGWVPADDLTEAEMRAANASADEAAALVLKNWDDEELKEWRKRKQCLIDWSRDALALTMRVRDRYMKFLAGFKNDSEECKPGHWSAEEEEIEQDTVLPPVFGQPRRGASQQPATSSVVPALTAC